MRRQRGLRSGKHLQALPTAKSVGTVAVTGLKPPQEAVRFRWTRCPETTSRRAAMVLSYPAFAGETPSRCLPQAVSIPLCTCHGGNRAAFGHKSKRAGSNQPLHLTWTAPGKSIRIEDVCEARHQPPRRHKGKRNDRVQPPMTPARSTLRRLLSPSLSTWAPQDSQPR